MRNHVTGAALRTAQEAVLLAVIIVVSGSYLLAKPSDKPTSIRVQIMDARTHHPLKGRRIVISFLDKNGDFFKPLTTKGRTGSDGIVVFEVKNPIPPRMGVFVWWVYPCSDSKPFSTQKVLEDGVVTHWSPTAFKKANKWCTADAQAPQSQTQPGRVVFFVHPMNRFVWSWYDTWR
jgi:hypothetical protein